MSTYTIKQKLSTDRSPFSINTGGKIVTDSSTYNSVSLGNENPKPGALNNILSEASALSGFDITSSNINDQCEGYNANEFDSIVVP